MPTNLQIIDQALQELGIVDHEGTATAKQAAIGLTHLNQMMYEWSVTDKDLHFAPQDTLSDTCPIPTWAEMAVVTNLAMHLSSPMRAPISPQLAGRAMLSTESLLRTLINLKNQGADMSHISQGSNGVWDITTDS